MQINLLLLIATISAAIDQDSPEAERITRACIPARNPVDWYALGEHAFTNAKRVNKPIVLSIWVFNLSQMSRHEA